MSLRVFDFSFSTCSIVLGFKVINHKCFQSTLYAVSLSIRTLKVHTSIYRSSCLPLIEFSHIIFMSNLLWLAAISCSSSSDYSVSFSLFFPRSGLRYIKLYHFDCLIYVPERAAGSGNWINPGSSPYVWGWVILPLWDYPSASHLSSYPRHYA